MRKVVAAMNMTLDGYCDHTAGIADAELHQYYTDLLNESGTVLYGRITYKLMEDYWPSVVKNPTGDKALDEFGIALENIPKVVFSHTLKGLAWKNVSLARRELSDEVSALKQENGKDILVGSPSLIVALTKLNLIDEYKLCIHPVVLGSGLPLFKTISETVILKRIEIKLFGSGSVAIRYERGR